MKQRFLPAPQLQELYKRTLDAVYDALFAAFTFRHSGRIVAGHAAGSLRSCIRVIRSRPTVRSRRRQSTFALFGRSLQRIRVEAPPSRHGPSHDAADGAPPSADARDDRDDDEPPLADLEELVTRLQREAQTDQRLKGLAANGELEALIEETARMLWATSRVKTFVPLLAIRRVYESLGLADESPAESQLTSRSR